MLRIELELDDSVRTQRLRRIDASHLKCSVDALQERAEIQRSKRRTFVVA